MKRNEIIGKIAEQIKESANYWRQGEVNINQTACGIYFMCRNHNKKEFKRKLKKKNEKK